MNTRLVNTCLSMACLLANSLYASQVTADWSGDRQHRSLNPGYGDFPPEDIDEQLFGQLRENNALPTEPADSTIPEDIDQPASSYTQQYPAQQGTYPPTNTDNYAPVTGNPGNTNQANANPVTPPMYGSAQNYPYRNNMANRGPRDNRSSFSGPWNNNGSSFSGPWNNRGSSFSGPWNNRGSNFSGPWNNRGSDFSNPWNSRGSSFSGPWNNNNSGFSMPWGNNNGRNGFSPWGNGGGMSW